jgi:tRNA G18 (ribose-2'-O)-methylase SpoU
MPFARLAPWPTGLQRVKAAGFVVAAMTPHPSADSGVRTVSLAELRASATSSDRPAGVALLLGAEGSGLTDSAVAFADVVIRIPMAEGVDSLNVATAAALAFHALADL